MILIDGHIRRCACPLRNLDARTMAPPLALQRPSDGRFTAETPLAKPFAVVAWGFLVLRVSFQDVANFKVTRLPGLSSKALLRGGRGTRMVAVTVSMLSRRPTGAESVTTN
jgi:hypothetical protein